MIDIMNPAALRQRFAELGEQREASLSVSAPLRAQRDAIVAAAAADVAALDPQIVAAEEGLFAIDQERAMLSRALGGRTGGE